MPPNEPQLDKLLFAVKNITEGNFDGPVVVDARGVVGEIASYLNQTLRKLRTLDKNLGKNVKETPETVSEVRMITEKTEQATLKVLDCADGILSNITDLRESISDNDAPAPEKSEVILGKIESLVFDIINSQEFQDVVQQRLHRITDSLEVFEQRLIDLVILFNISEENGVDDRNVELLKNLHNEETNHEDRQNLVDQLLAEFGM